MLLFILFLTVIFFDIVTHILAHKTQSQRLKMGRALSVPVSLLIFVILGHTLLPMVLAWVIAGFSGNLILAFTHQNVPWWALLKRMSSWWIGSLFLYVASVLFFSLTDPMLLALGWSITAMVMWGYTRFKAPRTLRKTFNLVPYRYPLRYIHEGDWSERLFLVQSKKMRLPMNALLFGKGNEAKILFSAPLLARLKSRHIESIIAHEIGHYHHRHLTKRMLLIVFFIVAFYGFGVLTVRQSPLLGRTLMTFVMGSTLWLMLFKYSLLALLHHQEYQADAFAHRFGLNETLSEALSIIDRYLKNTHPLSLYNRTQQTHPMTLTRIARLNVKESL